MSHCDHDWVYSPDKEKRVCRLCHLKERSRTLGVDGYFPSMWIAPPSEDNRYELDLLIKEWDSNNQQNGKK